jgi:hypothetical protein
MAHRKNTKRIDPRYFLEETANRVLQEERGDLANLRAAVAGEQREPRGLEWAAGYPERISAEAQPGIRVPNLDPPDFRTAEEPAGTETVAATPWGGFTTKEARDQAWWDQYLLEFPEYGGAPGDPMPAVLPWEEEEALAAKKEVSPTSPPPQKLGGSIPVREALRRMVMEEVASLIKEDEVPKWAKHQMAFGIPPDATKVAWEHAPEMVPHMSPSYTSYTNPAAAGGLATDTSVTRMDRTLRTAEELGISDAELFDEIDRIKLEKVKKGTYRPITPADEAARLAQALDNIQKRKATWPTHPRFPADPVPGPGRGARLGAAGAAGAAGYLSAAELGARTGALPTKASGEGYGIADLPLAFGPRPSTTGGEQLGPGSTQPGTRRLQARPGDPDYVEGEITYRKESITRSNLRQMVMEELKNLK